jgi:beta-glucosidase
VTVLLKNDGVLPLSKDVKNVVVIGPNGNDGTMQLGNYNGSPTKITTIFDGIKAKLPNANVSYVKGFVMKLWPVCVFLLGFILFFVLFVEI